MSNRNYFYKFLLISLVATLTNLASSNSCIGEWAEPLNLSLRKDPVNLGTLSKIVRTLEKIARPEELPTNLIDRCMILELNTTTAPQDLIQETLYCLYNLLKKYQTSFDKQEYSQLLQILIDYDNYLDSHEETDQKRKFSSNLFVKNLLRTKNLSVTNAAEIVGLLTVKNVHVTGNLIVDGALSGNNNATTNISNTFITSTTSDANALHQGGDEFSNDITFGSKDNFGLHIITDNIPQVTILSTGSVGIGTSSPQAKLDVSGSENISQNLSVDTTTFFVNSATHRVGIGTTSPNQQLEITGNLRLPATTGTSGIIYAAGNPLIHEYNDSTNFFAGTNAGNFTSSGIDNTGIGSSTLSVNTFGTLNVAVGSNALSSNAGTNPAQGSENTAIGGNALATNTTGFQNTALGSQADVSVPSISNATALGARAIVGASNTMVLGNTSITAVLPGPDGTAILGSSSQRWGQITSTVALNVVSDKRAKYNIADADLGLDFIKSLTPTKYKLKNETNNKIHYGLVAQEVEEVLKKCNCQNFGGLNYDKNVDSYGLSYGEFIAPLIKAVQELSQKVELLESKIGNYSGGTYEIFF